MAAIMVRVPIKSICRNFSSRLASMGFAAAGVSKNRKITAPEDIPIGRFM